MTDYLARNREVWTKANAEYTDGRALEGWQKEEIDWGMFGVPESEVGVLGDVAGKDVIELGCGTAYFGAWLARRGARVTGVDLTPAQLETARRMEAEFSLGMQFVEANAEETGLPDASFDLVAHANMIPFFDELARVVAPGGCVVFSFSAGPQTPIWVPPERLRRELMARGFSEFADFAAAGGTALLARKDAAD